MNIFRRLMKKKKCQPDFFEEEPVQAKFDILANFVADLESKADFNKAMGAMESIFKAYQQLRGITTDDDVAEKADYILHPEEGGKK